MDIAWCTNDRPESAGQERARHRSSQRISCAGKHLRQDGQSASHERNQRKGGGACPRARTTAHYSNCCVEFATAWASRLHAGGSDSRPSRSVHGGIRGSPILLNHSTRGGVTQRAEGCSWRSTRAPRAPAIPTDPAPDGTRQGDGGTAFRDFRDSHGARYWYELHPHRSGRSLRPWFRRRRMYRLFLSVSPSSGALVPELRKCRSRPFRSPSVSPHSSEPYRACCLRPSSSMWRRCTGCTTCLPTIAVSIRGPSRGWEESPYLAPHQRGGGGAFLRESLNTAIRGRDEMEGMLRTSGLAVIPHGSRPPGAEKALLPLPWRAAQRRDDSQRSASLVTSDVRSSGRRHNGRCEPTSCSRERSTG
jgi:hypothetical protein